MEQRVGDSLIIELSKLLSAERLESGIVLKALELICGGYQFECAMIYEIDFSDQFCLMEHYGCTEKLFPEKFSADGLEEQAREALARRGTIYIERKEDNPPEDAWLLKLYNADFLAVAPLTDEELHAYGLIVLSSAAQRPNVSEKDMETLAALLSMLVRYVGVRVYQRRIRQAQITLESVLDNTGIDIYVNDFHNHDILYVNKSMAAPYGGQEQFKGRKCWQVLFPGQGGPCEFCPQQHLIDEEGAPTKVYTWDYERSFDGSWFRVFSSAFYWVNGRLAHVVSSADITDNKKNEAIIENMAHYDQLTGLPNRRMLVTECDNRINKARATEPGYLLFMDIDGFKNINDTYGHDAGDEFLIQLGEFFTSIPLLRDAVYRNGGDEFVAIIGGTSITKANIDNLSHFIGKRFTQPWRLEKGTVVCGISIGVACYPEDGITAEMLLQKADMAMYLAKKSGGNQMCFARQLGEKNSPEAL